MSHPRFRSPVTPMLVFSLLVALTGCVKLGPDYAAPAPALPETWHVQDPALMPELSTAKQWWTLLGDPLLDQLVAEAERGSLSLKSAMARIDESRALYGVASGMKMPEVGASSGASRYKNSGFTANLFTLAARVDYELDLFGRVRRSLEAASADLAASEEDYRDVLISLYGEVALRYLEVRTLQAQLAALEDSLNAQLESEKLVKTRARLGLANELDAVKAERTVSALRVQLAPLHIRQANARNALAALLGQKPGSLDERLAAAAPIPIPPASVSIGLPMELARQRPDLRRAERQLAAQTARVGVASADLYPSFSLSGSLGQEASRGGDLFNANSRNWNVGVSVRTILFAGGRLRNQVAAEQARTEQALIAYEDTVLRALHQVEDAAYGLIENRRGEADLATALKSADRALELARKRYEEGLVDFQDVLDALAEKHSLENSQAQFRGASAAYFVNLYRALGGGWQPSPHEATPTKAAAP